MAQAVGLSWPPPPAVSLRNVIQLAGVPLAPVDLQLRACDGTSALIDPNKAPVELDLVWTDAGAGTPRQASWFELTLTNRDTGEVWGGRSFSATSGITIGIFPYTLTLYAHYEWTIVAHNGWGTSPAAVLDFNANEPAPRPNSVAPTGQPSSPPVTATGTLTLTLDSSNSSFSVLGVAWAVWHQTGTGFDGPMNAYGTPGKITLKAAGQYLISAVVTVLGQGSGNVAEFSRDTNAPDGSPAVVWVWSGGNVTKSFKVTSTTDGYGQPEALIILTS